MQQRRMSAEEWPLQLTSINNEIQEMKHLLSCPAILWDPKLNTNQLNLQTTITCEQETKRAPGVWSSQMRVPKPFQIKKRQIIGICSNPWKMHMFYVLISWNWILICTVKLHGSHHQTMHKQGSKSHLHFEKKMQGITEQDDCHFAISRESLNFRD
jgi:hypothetical protein